MRRLQGRFFWKLFIGNAALLAFVVVTCVWLILGAFQDFYTSELTNHLRMHAILLRHQLADDFDVTRREHVDRLVKELAQDQTMEFRITIVAADGTVLGDSEADPSAMEPHDGREEIMAALAGGEGESTRYSVTVSQMMRYFALRVGEASAPRGVVRVSMPEGSIVARAESARALILQIGIVVLAAAVTLALGLARIWSGRIARVTATARSLSRGDLTARADTRGADELALLARSLNRMRDDLARQLDTIDHQRRTLVYLLTQLHEGVIVVDEQGHVILANPAAEQLLGLATGCLRKEDAKNPACIADLPESVRRLVNSLTEGSGHDVHETEIDVSGDEGRATLLTRVSSISLPRSGEDPPEGGNVAGQLLVLTNVTELVRTIQVKSDFVANASHELRTPLSAIRAAVETLMSIDLASDVASAQPLLEIIDRHSDRLSAMVADLLDLSRIESPTKHFQVAATPLAEVIAELYERFAPRLLDKGLDWRMDIDPEAAMVLANRELLILVLDNLVDNAIKFTPYDGRIQVESRCDGEQVRVCVSDNGCGIAPEEQDRVFERFYQVERARTGTGAQRGTGLGLAIVRHAVNAMGGRIELHSELGEGTRLSLFLKPASGTRRV